MRIDSKIQRNFGFGCMRLPMRDGEVDHEEMTRMVDAFLEAGFNYFDTAHGYLQGKSELALRECLTSRYPRERYVLTNKLSTQHFRKQEDIRPLFESQLEACGVEYFDFYLMHAQNQERYEKFKSCRSYETALELLDEGRIHHFGISFHDTADTLEQILTEYPRIEVVQLQFNYVDYEDISVQSRRCYELCRRYGKTVFVMEPVKGGSLVNLPEAAQKVLDDLKGDCSNAGYAIRFAAGFEGIEMVLSGMSSMEQMADNISVMRDFRPLDSRERAAVEQVCDIFRSMKLIPCTACRYCTEVCPVGIAIPDLFACMNSKRLFVSRVGYYPIHSRNAKPSDCLGCGRCEAICPQKLPIRRLLKDVAEEFEK